MELKKIAVCSRSFSKNQQLRKELLSLYSDVKFNDSGINLNGASLVDFLKGCDGAIIGLETVNETLLSQLPELKVIGKYGVGVNNIDFYALSNHDVRFGWQKGVNRRSVAELTLGMMLALLRNITHSTQQLKEGVWNQIVGRELSQQNIGIIGCGHVGKELVKLLAPFGTQIFVYDTNADMEFIRYHNLKFVSKNELLEQSDVLTLHVPYNDLTRYMISKVEFDVLKKGSILVNTARGGLVDEEALYFALKTGKLSGAALDVFEIEPTLKHKLFELNNVIATPHIAGSTESSILAMGRCAIEGLKNNQSAEKFFGLD